MLKKKLDTSCDFFLIRMHWRYLKTKKASGNELYDVTSGLM